MATSKTITPTGESVSIPAMTDRPDASVFSNAISKTIDGVNKLKDKVIRIPASGTMAISAATTAGNIGTASDSRITSTMQCVHSVIGTPGYQTSDWSVTTSSGQVVVNGTCSAATTLILWLAEP